ncbi:hypothetical protein [Candidatus Rariloculus sp.]|uniref:hypothetical protein n=1 Tax=Candidatus Rariloculus sp. TaxID=3101265 RepID=UPI003D09800F
MRNLFLALVLANLLFAAWHGWFAETAAPVRRAALDVPGITLVGEIDDADAPAPDEALTRANTTLDPVERCISIGPFTELSQATDAEANLRASGYEPVQREGEGAIRVGYWAYLENIPAQEDANGILARLGQNGVTDANVLSGPAGNNIVSLGVFSDLSLAEQRRETVRGLGYDPIIAAPTRRGEVYWVEVILEGAEALDFELLQTPVTLARVGQRPCGSVPG